MESWEQWAMLAVAVVVVPTVGWLVKEVLTLRKDFVRFQAVYEERQRSNEEAFIRITDNCHQHVVDNSAIREALAKLDRNIVRLCQASGIQEER